MILLKKLNLLLFDGEGGGTAGPAGAAAAQGESGGNEQSGNAQNVVAARKGKANPLAGVKYGIQPQEETETSTVQPEPVKEPEAKVTFDDLIKGEYKKDFDSKVQSIINQRFKETKDLKENADKAAPLMGFLAKRFGKDAGDYDGLLNAMLDEDALFESMSMKNGESTEAARQRMRDEVEQDKIKRENESLRAQLEAGQKLERDREAARLWRQEADSVKAVYDNFNISEEMKNPKFVDFMNRGIGMKAAFELVHRDELMSGAMHYAAQKASEQVVNNIKAQAARPAENGTGNRASAQAKTDVSKLTKADLREISRRVSRGDKISFG